jgi:hypothetical protein
VLPATLRRGARTFLVSVTAFADGIRDRPTISLACQFYLIEHPFDTSAWHKIAAAAVLAIRLPDEAGSGVVIERIFLT